MTPFLPDALEFATVAMPSCAEEFVSWDGEVLTRFQGEAETTVRPSADQWRRFRLVLDEVSAWDWPAVSVDPGVLDGSSWQLTVVYPDRSVRARGTNAWPPGYHAFVGALRALLAGPPPGGDGGPPEPVPAQTGGRDAAGAKIPGPAEIGPGSVLDAALQVEALVGEGRFSRVYRGTRHLRTPGGPAAGPRAVKVARPFPAADPPGWAETAPATAAPGLDPAARRSQGLLVGTGFIGAFDPDPAELLALQAEKLRAADDPALVRVHEVRREAGTCWCELEWLDGPPLRALLAEGRAPLALFVELARALERLSRQPGFRYHGDLKPENVLLHAGRVRLIDPGQFEPGVSIPVQGMVTTPAYYPFLVPDDLFALGLMLWEAVLGWHPLFPVAAPPAAEGPAPRNRRLGPWLQRFASTGHRLLRPFRDLPRPAELRPGLDPRWERVLLKVLGFRPAGDGGLERVSDTPSAYAGFACLAGDLEGLIGGGRDAPGPA